MSCDHLNDSEDNGCLGRHKANSKAGVRKLGRRRRVMYGGVVQGIQMHKNGTYM